MIFPVADLPQPTVDAAESTERRTVEQLSMREEPKAPIKALTFAYQKRILQVEPGRLQLRLRETPQVFVDPATLECEVVGWGVKMPAQDVEHLSRAMARRFLELFSKADAGNLKEHEQKCWVQILDRIDYQAFCIDRAAPHYMEGTIVSKQPEQILVEWHDGTRERLDRRTARSLELLERGEQFGAWVKLGRENTTSRIENVVMLPAPES